MKIKGFLVGVLVMVVSVFAVADEAAVGMLKRVSQQMVGQLERNRGHVDGQVVGKIVNNVLLPHVDLEAMSRSVVGRQYWVQASGAQKAEFKRAFTNLVIKVYSAPLATYNGETIEFKRMRDQSAARPQVESIVIRKNGQRIPVSYRLVKSGGEWKVYDFSVEGISMISSYRSQFDSILREQGMAGLLNKLKS